jgi:hypothetical protein
MHAHDTAYEIAAQQFSSAMHAQDTTYGITVQHLSSSAVHCMHTILHMRSQLSSSAVHCMHKILHMGSQFSTSAVQQFVTYTRYCIWDRSFAAQQFSSALHAQDTAYGIAVQQFSSSAVRYMHTILHMGSQFSSSVVQQFSSALHAQVTAYGSQFHSSAVQMHAQGTANGIAVQQLSNTVQQRQLLSAYVDTSGTKFFIDESTPMGMCFCMQLNLMWDSRL